MEKFDEKKFINMVKLAEFLYYRFEQPEGLHAEGLKEKKLAEQEQKILDYVKKFVQ